MIINLKFILIMLFLLIGIYLIFKQNNTFQSNSVQNYFNNIYKEDFSDMDDTFNEFFNQSSEQQLISKKVIFKTMKYIMEEKDEYDPELIDFVRSLIVKPSRFGQINLNNKDKNDFSQLGQSEYFDKLLGQKRNGFFVESGGFDGEAHSNSIFFELERNWTGILIEPIPSYFKKIISKNRQIYVLNACLASKKPLLSKFRVSDVLSGRVSEISLDHNLRIDKVFGKKKVYVNVPCFSLNTILKALDVTYVDYFSLDVEGGELTVLQSLDYQNMLIKSISIEYNGIVEARKNIIAQMTANSYKFLKDDNQDLYFMKK